jgi:hypothetical protein
MVNERTGINMHKNVQTRTYNHTYRELAYNKLI